MSIERNGNHLRILGVMVLYYPRLEDVTRRVRSIKESVEQLFLWDNTPHTESIKAIAGVPVYGRGENIGLAGAYNEALRYATREGYNYLLTLDQDTDWVGSLDDYLDDITSYERQTPHRYATLFFARTSTDPTAYSQRYNEIAHGGVNAGAVVPVSFLNAIGGYPSDFFVDGLDDYLQLAATAHGLTNIRVCGEMSIHQHYGNPQLVSFAGKKFYTYNYPPERYYYILRNYAILLRRFKTPNSLKKKYIKTFLLTYMTKIALGEKEKRRKIGAILRGAYDGFFKYKI